MPSVLPLPPKELRILVGPFSDVELFVRSADRMVADVVSLCGLTGDAQVLDVGCGCGRLARALAGYLGPAGRYDGFDLARDLVAWCKQNLEPHLQNFHFSFVDVRSPDRNPQGAVAARDFHFPFPEDTFDLAILSSVFTHMLPDEIENYVAQLSRVLNPRGCCFMSVFLFDPEAEAAVAAGSTIFDFRHPIGPSLTFNAEAPNDGMACRKRWFLELIERHGLRVEAIQAGNWRHVRSYEVSQDYVVARKACPSLSSDSRPRSSQP
jgi:SAM-dependent methyltransferase